MCANLLPIFKNDNAAWCQTEEVLDVVLPLEKTLFKCIYELIK